MVEVPGHAVGDVPPEGFPARSSSSCDSCATALSVEDLQDKLLCSLSNQVLETNGSALIEFLKLIPGDKKLCFEEGTQSQWLFEILGPHVQEVVDVQKEEPRTFGTRVFKAKSRFRKLGTLVSTYTKIQQDKRIRASVLCVRPSCYRS